MIDIFVPIDPRLPEDRLPELTIPGREPVKPVRQKPVLESASSGDGLVYQLDADALVRLRIAQLTRDDKSSFDRAYDVVRQGLDDLSPVVDQLGPLEQASVGEALLGIQDAGLDAKAATEALREVLRQQPISAAQRAFVTPPAGGLQAARPPVFDGQDIDAFTEGARISARPPVPQPGVGPDGFDWGWTLTEPGASCAKVANIPRACLGRQCIAYPALLEPPLHQAFYRLFRRRAWSWLHALPDDQLDLSEAQLLELLVVDRLLMMKALRFAHRNTARLPAPQVVQADTINAWASARLLPAPGVAADRPRWVDSHRTDSQFVDRLLNGIYPVLLEPDPASTGGLLARIDSTRYAYDGKYQALPDVKVHLQPDERSVKLTGITLQYRGQGATQLAPADEGEWSEWAHAKRVARMAANVHGQVDWHLARGHLISEMVQVVLSRTIADDRHPIARLLEPHVSGTASINNYGEDIIVGAKGAVVRCSALSNAGSLQFVSDKMGGLDWKGFAPRTPLFEGHFAARAQQRFWTQVQSYVAGFIDENDPRSWTQAHKDQARDFVAELIKNSMTATVTAADRDRLRPEDRNELALPADAPSRQSNELSQPAALHPIDPERRDDWVQFCAWVIHHASFVHSWANDGMIYDNGHLLHGALGMKKAGTPSGEADFWDHYALDADDGYFQLLLIETLVRIRWLNLGQQDEPAPPKIPEAVRAHFSTPDFVAEMKAALFDPSRIRARANV